MYVCMYVVDDDEMMTMPLLLLPSLCSCSQCFKQTEEFYVILIISSCDLVPNVMNVVVVVVVVFVFVFVVFVASNR